MTAEDRKTLPPGLPIISTSGQWVGWMVTGSTIPLVEILVDPEPDRDPFSVAFPYEIVRPQAVPLRLAGGFGFEKSIASTHLWVVDDSDVDLIKRYRGSTIELAPELRSAL